MSTSDIIAGALIAFLGGSMFLTALALFFLIWDEYQDNKKRRKNKQ